MKKLKRLATKLIWVMALPVLLLGFAHLIQGASGRNYIHLVGSSTVFPFAAAAAEQFSKATDYPAPLVERNGTGIGIKLFCAGVGLAHPDLANASRKIKPSEERACRANGVKAVEEILLGHDGIVVAQAKDFAPLQLTVEHLYLALAAEIFLDGKLVPNPYQFWNQLDPSLPHRPIHLLGPSATSGTYDVVIELVMEKGARTSADMRKVEEENPRQFKRLTRNLRTDGAYVEVSENDNMVIQKLRLQPEALGFIGFSFYDKNGSELHGLALDGVSPSLANLSNYRYPLARPLFIYFKKDHFSLVPGLEQLITEIKQAQTSQSYLAREGLVVQGAKPAPKGETWLK